MLKLIIEDDEGRKTVVPFVRDEITIGRQEGNMVRLTERNVSRRHARLRRQNGAIVVEDLQSRYGVRVNGERIDGEAAVHNGDRIQIGDYRLAVENEADRTPAPRLAAYDADATPPHGVQTRRSAAAYVALAEPITEVLKAQRESVDPHARSAAAPGADARGSAQATSLIRAPELESSRPHLARELSAHEAPRLVVINTELAGREYACLRTELRIGRTEENDIGIDHRSLSRTHAKLVRENSGAWRIIDLQSANGLSVNGERYAQATLSHLDTIVLGHVQLRFVGPGQTFSLQPAAAAPKWRRSKLPAVIGVVGLVGTAAAYLLLSGSDEEPRPASRAKVASPVKKPSPLPEPTRKLRAAQEALKARDFQGAARLAREVKEVPGIPLNDDTQAEEVLGQARAEIRVKEQLDEAAKALEADKLDQAEKLLEETQATRTYSDLHQGLREKLAARKSAAKQEAASASAAQESQPAPVGAAEEAKKLYDDGVVLFTRKQNREARAVFNRCLEVDSTFARCHLMLGSAAARLGEPDVGARHYQMFLELSPKAPEAPKVRAFLADYKNSKKRDSN